MTEGSSYLSIITLHVNGLNSPIKREKDIVCLNRLKKKTRPTYVPPSRNLLYWKRYS
jgi:hypothetical protein